MHSVSQLHLMEASLCFLSNYTCRHKLLQWMPEGHCVPPECRWDLESKGAPVTCVCGGQSVTAAPSGTELLAKDLSILSFVKAMATGGQDLIKQFLPRVLKGRTPWPSTSGDAVIPCVYWQKLDICADAYSGSFRSPSQSAAAWRATAQFPGSENLHGAMKTQVFFKAGWWCCPPPFHLLEQ